MDLTTRCPECGTTFSASLAQLQLRKGYIRCIKCAHIFDGYEAVVSAGVGAVSSEISTEPATSEPVPQKSVVNQEPSLPPVLTVPNAPDAPDAPQEPSVSMPSVLRQRPRPANEPVHHISAAQTGPDPAFTISTQAVASTPASGQARTFHLGQGHTQARPEPTLGAARTEAVEPVVHSTDTGHDVRASGLYVEPRSGVAGNRPADNARSVGAPEHGGAAQGSMGRLLWGGLVFLGVLLLLAQLAYIYRAQIANNVPALRPVLERACIPLECQIPYARQIDQISIMSSSLRSGAEAAAAGATKQTPAADGQTPATMLLQLTMRNSYDKPQEWPTLVLDLTDLSGTRVVRKNLPPQGYLPAEVVGQPFKAGSEITVEVPIVMKDVKVNGYQLDKFFQ